MLYVLFYVDQERYALACDSVVEIIPRVSLRPVAQAEEHIVGLLNYGGNPVPVVDFSQLCVHRSSSSHLSTRIILVNYEHPERYPQLVGLLAERVTDTLEKPADAFVESGISLRPQKFVKGVLNDKQGVIYLVQLEHLFDGIHEVMGEL